MNQIDKFSEDETAKILFELEDKAKIESVIIEQQTTISICISTQVGCPVGCKFCRSGESYTRNLSKEEIMGQIDEVNKIIGETEKKKSIVFMGIGEPLLNLENLAETIKELCVTRKQQFSKRRITVSTVGIPEKIIELGERTKKMMRDDNATVNLAISLHFTNDTLRQKYIPIAKKYPIEEIFSACKKFQDMGSKKQSIMFEYIMLKGINDSEEDIGKLIGFIKKYEIRALVNLIPYNGSDDSGFKATSDEKIKEYKQTIIKEGIKCFVRLSRGRNINAACGMLASKNR